MKETYRVLGRKNEHECAADGVKPSANGAYEQREILSETEDQEINNESTEMFIIL